MTLLMSGMTYEPKIKEFKDISPESVLAMIKEVIKELEPFRIGNCLSTALGLIETGECEIPACSVTTKVDLSLAKRIINTYRKYSEGGCQSCIKLGQEVLDAQDATSGWYCKESDPDYNKDNVMLGRHGCRFSGLSPKVNKYHNKPCGEDWKPTFSPPLEELIKANS